MLKGITMSFIPMIGKRDVPKPCFGYSQPRSIQDFMIESDKSTSVAKQVGFRVLVTWKETKNVLICHLRHLA